MRPSRTSDLWAIQRLRAARDRIDRDYAEHIPVSRLAAESGYSVGEFIRAFRQVYGETPGAYRSRRRVERVADLLRVVNLTVTEVCLLVGFQSLGTFSRRFTQLVGKPPRAYQAEALKGAAITPIPGCFALMWRTPLRPGEAGCGPAR